MKKNQDRARSLWTPRGRQRAEYGVGEGEATGRQRNRRRGRAARRAQRQAWKRGFRS